MVFLFLIPSLIVVGCGGSSGGATGSAGSSATSAQIPPGPVSSAGPGGPGGDIDSTGDHSRPPGTFVRSDKSPGGIISAADHTSFPGIFVETDRAPGYRVLPLLGGQSERKAHGHPLRVRKDGKAKGLVFPDILGSWSSGASGTWSYYSGDDTWSYVNIPATCLALGDVVGNDGKDDIIGSWTSGESGTWVRNSNGGGWYYLNIPAVALAVGNFHGTGNELLCSFDSGESGTYTYNFTTTAWTYINIPAVALASTDIDGDGKDDIIGSWTSGESGTWVWSSEEEAWYYLNIPAIALAAGNFHGTGNELLCSFDSSETGTFTYNFTTDTWTYINIPAVALAAADIDGDGIDDIIGSWTSGASGTWIKNSNGGAWSRINIPATTLAGGYLTNVRTGTVTGNVIGPGSSGNPLSNVLVTSDDPSLQLLTDIYGNFTINDVPIGTRTYNFSKNGMEPQTITTAATYNQTTTLKTAGYNNVVLEGVTGGPQTKTWTLMVYMAGDNSSLDMVDYSLYAMEKVAPSDNVSIVALVDKPDPPAQVHKTRFYCIHHDSHEGEVDASVTSPYFEYPTNLDTGNVDTLNNFMSRVATDYPADHYFVDLWGEGSGFKNCRRTAGPRGKKGVVNRRGGHKGICWDDGSSTPTYLSIPQVRGAFQAFKTLIGKNIDIVACDTSYMQQLEVAYEWRGACDYLVGSEEAILDQRFPYDTCFGYIVDELNNSNNPTAQEFAHSIVTKYGEFCTSEDHTYQDSTLSAVNMSQIQSLYDNVNVFANMMELYEIDRIQDLYFNKYLTSTYFGDNEFIDLHHFADRVRNDAVNNYDSRTKNAADSVHSQIEATMAANFYGADFNDAGTGGISIWGYYAGSIPTGSIYGQLLFYPNAWSSFIDWINENS
jgi:hypothetical protein